MCGGRALVESNGRGLVGSDVLMRMMSCRVMYVKTCTVLSVLLVHNVY